MAKVLDDVIASYDDNFQPTGESKWDPLPHFKMKKLHHDLHFVIEGPDDGAGKARDCVNQAIKAGIYAAVGAAFIGVGTAGALVAWTAVNGTLLACLGGNFSVRLDDISHWEEWWT